MLGSKDLRLLIIGISLFTNSSDSTMIKDLVLRCSKAVGSMKIHSLHSNVRREPTILKRRLSPYDLREVLKNELNELIGKVIIILTELLSQ